MNYKNVLIVFSMLFIVSCSTEEPIEYHHIFPQKYRNQFKMAGIDVDEYTVPLSKSKHGWITHKFNLNKQWEDFFRANPQPSKKMILDFAEDITSKSGIKIAECFNYKTKSSSGRSFTKKFGFTSGFKSKVIIYILPIIKSLTFEPLTKKDKNFLITISIILAIGGTIAIYLYFGWIIALIYLVINIILIILANKYERLGFFFGVTILTNFVLTLSIILPLYILIIVVVILIILFVYFWFSD